jgi:hypothetical protein
MPNIVETPRLHYWVHDIPPRAPILSQMNSFDAVKLYPFKIHFNIILLSEHRTCKWCFPPRVDRHQTWYAFLLPVRATFPAAVKFLDFITLVILVWVTH